VVRRTGSKDEEDFSSRRNFGVFDRLRYALITTAGPQQIKMPWVAKHSAQSRNYKIGSWLKFDNFFTIWT